MKRLTDLYYIIRPLLPRGLQLALRRAVLRQKRRRCAAVWPILPSAGRPPEGWKGWPEQKRFALVLTHDVDTQRGHDRIRDLLDLEERLGFRSSLNLVPERYLIDKDILLEIPQRGFELGVHGLKHDGKLFRSRATFEERLPHINRYLRDWGAVGFRAPAMHHNLDWILEFDVEYDASTFDTDPFEPQPDGVGTIFPFWVPGRNGRPGYVELPYTLAQDHGLLVMMQEKDDRIWRQKLDWIAERGGMALLNTHPDYMCFGGKAAREEFPIAIYASLLNYIKTQYAGQYWHALPREVARDFRARHARAGGAA